MHPSLLTTDRLGGPRCWLTAFRRYDMLMLLVEENGVIGIAPNCRARPTLPRKSMRQAARPHDGRRR
jgi:hypothetical protein